MRWLSIIGSVGCTPETCDECDSKAQAIEQLAEILGLSTYRQKELAQFEQLPLYTGRKGRDGKLRMHLKTADGYAPYDTSLAYCAVERVEEVLQEGI